MTHLIIIMWKKPSIEHRNVVRDVMTLLIFGLRDRSRYTINGRTITIIIICLSFQLSDFEIASTVFRTNKGACWNKKRDYQCRTGPVPVLNSAMNSWQQRFWAKIEKKQRFWVKIEKKQRFWAKNEKKQWFKPLSKNLNLKEEKCIEEKINRSKIGPVEQIFWAKIGKKQRFLEQRLKKSKDWKRTREKGAHRARGLINLIFLITVLLCIIHYDFFKRHGCGKKLEKKYNFVLVEKGKYYWRKVALCWHAM